MVRLSGILRRVLTYRKDRCLGSPNRAPVPHEPHTCLPASCPTAMLSDGAAAGALGNGASTYTELASARPHGCRVPERLLHVTN